MKAFKVVACASGLFVLALVSGACAYREAAAPARTLTGELVVTDVSANRFRVVGYDGFFTAPVGTPLPALDGHNVQVELTSNNRVMEIAEAPVHIDPIAHGWGTARGELIVTDAATGRFHFAGDNQTYVAPSAVDVTSYAGRLVEVRLGESGQVADMHVVSSPDTSYIPANPAPAGSSCSYRDQAYSAGATVCQSGTQYRCEAKQWQSLGIGCQTSDARALNAPTRSLRGCLVGDSTVANSSDICRDGSTFRCDDGEWIDVRTACR